MAGDKKVTLKDEIVKQLEKSGTLSDVDLAQMAPSVGPKPPEETPKVPEADKDSKVKVGDEKLDAAVKTADGETADEIMARELLPLSTNPDDPYAMTDNLEPVTITKEDKARFMDAFVDGSRFTRPFSLMGGRLTGIFRSRKVKESRALLQELGRQAVLYKLSMTDYTAKVRHAVIHSQLAEINGVARPEWKEPLVAMEVQEGPERKVTVKPPEWALDMEAYFNEKDEGWVDALYHELRLFEKVYWEMVTRLPDQNFWTPEDSIIE
jgi:hypothetical protein